MLTASRHPVAEQVIVITESDVAPSDGNVVARYNETHGILTRTHYTAGPKPALKDVRAAIAALQDDEVSRVACAAAEAAML